MASDGDIYSVEYELAEFFSHTSTTRQACDIRAGQISGGGNVSLVPIQGVCSYTVFAGPEADIVVQFRLKSLAIPLERVKLAHEIYGTLVPDIRFEGRIGDDEVDKETLYIYVMPRMKGTTWLEYRLASMFPEDSPESCASRLTLIADVARYFAISWKSPQKFDQSQSDRLQQTYSRELELLSNALPERFHTTIQDCQEALPSIMKLPMVLTHKDFYESNLLVSPDTCHLTGVVDWGDATIEPFGVTLNCTQSIMGKVHLKNGYIRHDDYNILHDTFWKTLEEEVGGWSKDTLRTIQSAMILGQLLEAGFTNRLGKVPDTVPISNDEKGAYHMRLLDGRLINPATKMI